jgi:hypothetical protein
MSARTVRTRRPRLLPAALLASGVVVATAATVLAATDPPASPAVQSCGSGREWVTVHPLTEPAGEWRAAAGTSTGTGTAAGTASGLGTITGTEQTQPVGAALTGCVDTSRLPAGTQTDSRG